MDAEPNPILPLLESLCDGADIDWERAERACRDEGERRLLRSLRVVSGVYEFHGRPAESRALHPGDRFGHLVIREHLGAGAWGQVYRADDTRLRRSIALKIVDRALANGSDGVVHREGWRADETRYLEEARRLASVRHPNVVTVYAVEHVADPPGPARSALLLEYIPGQTLFELVAAEGRRGAPEVIAIGVELCRALAAVHGAGLVHRDVKAQNVMREDGGRIVLMDFGPVGATPLYMAPELFRGATPTPRSDLYGLGVLLYYLATAAYPVSGDDLDDLRQAHARGRRVPLRDVRPDLPADLVQVLERALAPDPADRYATAGEMERALGSCLRVVATPRTERGVPEAGGLARRRRLRALAAIGIVVPLVVVGLLAFRGERPARPSSETGKDGSSILPPQEAGALPSFSIEAAVWSGPEQRRGLREGSPVSPGDSISLSFLASDDLYVYVINEDAFGEAYLLFPSPDFVPANPLAARERHLLPGTREGREVYWQVTSAGGQERLLIVASPRRLASLEKDASSLKRPEKDEPVRYARLQPDALLEELRGMGGWVEGGADPAPAFNTQGLFEMAEPLPEGREDVRGVWIRRLDLVNPGR